MATGDVADIRNRIKELLPRGWFGDAKPVLDAVLTGISSALASVYGLIGYARLQTRISTATDGFLDLISLDFFGLTLPRKSQETDTAFRTRILAELFLERGTRRGLIRALQLLTGWTPLVFEFARAADTGGLNTPSMGLNVAGYLGSYQYPCQAVVVAYRPLGQGFPFVPGLNTPQAALNEGHSALVNPALIAGAVTDQDIYNTISNFAPVGTVIWTLITNYAANASAYTDEAGLTSYTDQFGVAYTTES